MRFAMLALAGLLLASSAAAGQVASPEPGATIPPVVWELRQIATGRFVTDIADPAAYTVQFLPDGTLLLRADCNIGGGSYRLTGNAIELGGLRITAAACPPQSLDQTFLQLLEQVQVWSYRADRLVLEAPGRGRLEFSPQLQVVNWDWQALRAGNDEVVAPPDPRSYSLVFLPNGTLLVSADCNSGRGTYDIAGDAIDLRLTAFSRSTCRSDSLDKRFLADLDEVSSFAFRAGDLYLALPMDAGILAFSPRLDLAAGAIATPVAP